MMMTTRSQITNPDQYPYTRLHPFYSHHKDSLKLLTMFSKVYSLAVVLAALLPLTTNAGSLFPSKIKKRGLQMESSSNAHHAEQTPRRLASPEDIFLRNLQLADCGVGDYLTCLAENEGYDGCGGISQRTDGQWCNDSDLGDICCGNFSDCCELKPGATAGLIIALVVIIILIVIASCSCCSCCPWYDKLCCAPRTNATPAPVVYSGAVVAGSSTTAAAAPSVVEMPTANATEIKASPY